MLNDIIRAMKKKNGKPNNSSEKSKKTTKNCIKKNVRGFSASHTTLANLKNESNQVQEKHMALQLHALHHYP